MKLPLVQVPIDGVGVQMHYGKPNDKLTLAPVLNALLGL